MSKISTAIKTISDPGKFVYSMGRNGLLNWLPDELYLKILFRAKKGTDLNLSNPITFNEKLQWLKLYDRNPRYISLVDKITAKEVVGKLIGSEHIVPIYGTWKNASEIDFEMLPNQVVLKCNHDQGSVVIIDNLQQFDINKAIVFLNRKLKRSPYPGSREYAYSKIKPMVFAEKYLGSSIIDYKFYCFNGVPRFLYCGKGLTSDHSLKIDFFDMNWHLMPFYRTDYERLGEIECPTHFEEMKKIALKLSKGIPFVRIDLFEVDNTVYFSEFTLCPAAGYMPFVPEEYDKIVGSWLELPNK